MALWNIFLWLLVGVLAFIIGLSSVERRLNPAPVSNLPNSSEKLFADIAEEPYPPISEIGDEEYISEFALPNDELEEARRLYSEKYESQEWLDEFKAAEPEKKKRMSRERVKADSEASGNYFIRTN